MADAAEASGGRGSAEQKESGSNNVITEAPTLDQPLVDEGDARSDSGAATRRSAGGEDDDVPTPVPMRLARQFSGTLLGTMKKPYYCQICLANEAPENGYTLTACGHTFCKDCLDGFLSSRINDGYVFVRCCYMQEDGASSATGAGESGNGGTGNGGGADSLGPPPPTGGMPLLRSFSSRLGRSGGNPNLRDADRAAAADSGGGSDNTSTTSGKQADPDLGPDLEAGAAETKTTDGESKGEAGGDAGTAAAAAAGAAAGAGGGGGGRGPRMCDTLIVEKDLRALITDAAVFHKYSKFKFNREHKDARQCPKCDHNMVGDGEKNPKMVCEECGHEFCFWHSDAHPGKTCTEYDREHLEETKQAEALIAKTSKPCPVCGMPAIKAGGCNHMTCAYCKADWCWLCGATVEKSVTPFHFNALNVLGCPGQQFAGDMEAEGEEAVQMTPGNRCVALLKALIVMILLGPPSLACTVVWSVLCLPCLCHGRYSADGDISSWREVFQQCMAVWAQLIVSGVLLSIVVGCACALASIPLSCAILGVIFCDPYHYYRGEPTILGNCWKECKECCAAMRAGVGGYEEGMMGVEEGDEVSVADEAEGNATANPDDVELANGEASEAAETGTSSGPAEDASGNGERGADTSSAPPAEETRSAETEAIAVTE